MASRKATIDLGKADVLAAERELCQRSLSEFIQRSWPEFDPAPYIHNWHIDAMSEHLEAVADGRVKRLLINVPPGTAKSNVVSVMFPAWMWTHRPQWRSLCTSHNEELAINFTVKSRRLMQSRWYQQHWPIALRDDQNQKTYFENTLGGSRQAKPFRSLTGSRGNCLIIDDPHSVDDAKSAAFRTATVETFLESTGTRLNNPKEDAVVVIMQRLHEEDVSGTIIARELGYEHLCVPMEFDKGASKTTSIGWSDPRKKDGELLFPKRFGPLEIKQYKRQLGPFAYAGQFQQTPAPKTDGFFRRDWFHRYGGQPCPHPHCGGGSHPVPRHLSIYMTSDHAPAGTQRGDYNVVRVWGVDAHRNLWLLDSFRRRCQVFEALGIQKDQEGTRLLHEGALPFIRKWKPMCWFPEGDHAWKAARGMTEAFMREFETYCRIEVQPTNGMGDKAGKAGAYQSMAAMGNVYLPHGQIGDEALLEYLTFPAGKHDDQVDADGVIARVLQEAHPAVVPPMDVSKEPKDYAEESSGQDASNVQDSFW